MPIHSKSLNLVTKACIKLGAGEKESKTASVLGAELHCCKH